MDLGSMLKKHLGHSGDGDEANGAPEEDEGGDEQATELAQEVITAVKASDAAGLANALAKFVSYCGGEEPSGGKKGVALILGK